MVEYASSCSYARQVAREMTSRTPRLLRPAASTYWFAVGLYESLDLERTERGTLRRRW